MKLAIAAYLIATSAGIAKAQECVQGMWELELTGKCDYTTILAAYEQQVFGVTGSNSCAEGTVTAEEELVNLLDKLNQNVDTLCQTMYDNVGGKTNFFEAAGIGKDYKFEQAFYNGYSKWVEEVETTYERKEGDATSVLREDAASVNAFYQGDGSYSQVGLPPLENFEECIANAVMCCWPKDRQAADNNGNCNRNTYSENCVDKDPADNTNLCSVDLEKGAFASGFNSADGIVQFPGDGDDGEGSIHCHGYAWANDEHDPTNRYKANNLFYVSMYDHMHQRGYVENIPGAPMCGCVEKMPTVTRSDCTQVDLTEDFTVTFDGASIEAKFTKVEVDFNACQGKGGRNNDLFAYTHRLFEEKKINRYQFGTVGRSLTQGPGDSRCQYAMEAELAKKDLKYGYVYDQKNWTKVAGSWGMSSGKPAMGQNAFKTAYDQSTHQIIKRVCGDCVAPTHKEVYHRRFTDIPDSFDLLDHLMNGQNDASGNSVWNVDFQLYSTYEDAVNDVNRWPCNNGFNYGAVFDGECSPSGVRSRNQWLKFSSANSSPVRNVGIYVDKPEDVGVKGFRMDGIWADEDIGHPHLQGSTTENDGAYHMTCGGTDIWGRNDQGHFMSRKEHGDIEVVVHVDEIAPITNAWAKAGIMVRSNYDDDSMTAFGLLSGTNGVAFHTRLSKGNYMTMPGGNHDLDQTASWLKLSKIGSLVSFYYSEDGETWVKQGEENIFFAEDVFSVGLACTSHNTNDLAEATFSSFQVTRYAAPTASPTVSSAPTAWDANEDIGEPLRNGEYNPEDGNGVEKIQGGGSGIWGTNDSFFFHAYQHANDDFTVTAFVRFTSWERMAKGGIMIRGDGSAGASNVLIGGMGSYNGIGFQSRSSAGEATVHHGTHWVNGNKAWVRLIKTGGLIEALYRPEDEEEWMSLGTKAVDFTGATVQVGYAVTVGKEDNRALADLYANDYLIE